MAKIVAIHQPNFLPWIGYFDKICRSTIFVFLDHVQYPKKGGVWCNRVKMLFAGEPRWVSVPIVRNYSGVRVITEMEFLANSPWREMIIKGITLNYSRAPFFAKVMQLIEPLVMNPTNNIASYNMHSICEIARHLGIPQGRFCRSSELKPQGLATSMLIDLTKRVGGDTYLCGGGSDGYQNDTEFEVHGVTLKYQRFEHPRYSQLGTQAMVPGLSIIDALMNVGFSGVQRMLGLDRDVT